MLRDLLFLFLILAVPFGIGVYLLFGGPGSEHVTRAATRAVKSGWLARGLGIGAAVALIGGLGWAMWARSATPAAWAAFAARAGLNYEEGRGPGVVQGFRKGRAVTMRVREHTDLHRRKRSVFTELRVELQGAPAQLSVAGAIEMPGFVRGLTSRMADAVGAPKPLTTGDAEFDDSFHVFCPDEEAAAAWLDAERRSTLTEFLTEPRYLVSGGAVAFQTQYPLTDRSEIEARLDRLEEFAERLER